MSGAHEAIGFAVVGGFVLLLLWGGAAWGLKRGPGGWFWRLLALLQAALLLQLVAGVVLLVQGGRRPLLHYVYGILFPALVLGAAHLVARGLEGEQDAAKVFTVASFFVTGLTLRALMTGLGL